MAARSSRLSAIRSDLEKDFVKPSKLRTLEPPVEVVAAMPKIADVPDEGVVIVDLPAVGATPMAKLATPDGPLVAPPPNPVGNNPRHNARRWTPTVLDRILQHALSDDYRASLPACKLLMEYGWGTPRQAEPEAEQTAIDMSTLPVRDRIKMLLEARGGAPEVPRPVVPSSPAVTAPQEPAASPAAAPAEPPAPPTPAPDDTSFL